MVWKNNDVILRVWLFFPKTIFIVINWNMRLRSRFHEISETGTFPVLSSFLTFLYAVDSLKEKHVLCTMMFLNLTKYAYWKSLSFSRN